MKFWADLTAASHTLVKKPKAHAAVSAEQSHARCQKTGLARVS
jgi:hypothetical protein